MSTHTAASASLSSLPGGSLCFPSFIPTACAALGAPFASSAFFASSVAGFTTNVFLASVPFRARVSHRSFVAVYRTFTFSSSGIRRRPRSATISPKLVEQIRLGEYIDLVVLLPDSLRNNELPRELMLEHQHLVIRMSPPRREVRDIIRGSTAGLRTARWFELQPLLLN